MHRELPGWLGGPLARFGFAALAGRGILVAGLQSQAPGSDQGAAIAAAEGHELPAMRFGPGRDGPQLPQGEGPGPRHQFHRPYRGLAEGGLAKGRLHQRQSTA